MKIATLFLPLALIISTALVVIVASKQVSAWMTLQQKQARTQAVDGCMQDARYIWQQPNAKNPQLMDTNQEPNRYWYKLCMQEKGYDVVSDI